MTAASSDPGEPSSEQFESSQLIDAVRVREQFLEDILGSLESFVTIGWDWRCTFATSFELDHACRGVAVCAKPRLRE
jgi:hypothetical protein